MAPRSVPAALVAKYEADLPPASTTATLPKIIHQTYRTRELPPLLADNVADLRTRNPGWDYRFYDDATIDSFVRDTYSPGVYRTFRRIAPSYGVVRADLFRYLVIFASGGVYLDIKSGFERPIDTILSGDERFIVSYWDNAPGQAHEGWGQHPELADQPWGEIQQWHVIAVPGHPFLRRVIATTLARIEMYRPWHDGVGWAGVINLSGPVAYTKAIVPILADHPHTAIRDHTRLGLVYSVAAGHGHKAFFKNHYVENHNPIVRLGPLSEAISRLYTSVRAWNRRRVGKKISER